MFLISGGRLPTRGSKEAMGYDVYPRAIVDVACFDEKLFYTRKSLFDFTEPEKSHPFYSRIVEASLPNIGVSWGYRLEPGEIIHVGIGFVAELPNDRIYTVRSRSGLASRHGLIVLNCDIPVDSDYRAEANAMLTVLHGYPHLVIHSSMRIAQIVFERRYAPRLTIVNSFEDIGRTKRGQNGFGSTGLFDSSSPLPP